MGRNDSFAPAAWCPIFGDMNAVTLSPDLERFAADAVASGRYQDMAAIVEAGVSLLRRTEAARSDATSVHFGTRQTAASTARPGKRSSGAG